MIGVAPVGGRLSLKSVTINLNTNCVNQRMLFWKNYFQLTLIVLFHLELQFAYTKSGKVKKLLFLKFLSKCYESMTSVK